MSTAGQSRRTRALEQLAQTEFDLLVVGGGIIGSRIAYEAARAGLRTALVDAGDFGGATSSASSKMIHGGLRYLAMYDFGLAHQAHPERPTASVRGLATPELLKRFSARAVV